MTHASAMPVPNLADYLSHHLAYCPTEGAFYIKAQYITVERRGELDGVFVTDRKAITMDGTTPMVRAGAKYNRKGVNAAKLAWYMTHGQWPYFVGMRNGPTDLRVMAMHALITELDYRATMGDRLYWERAFADMPELPAPECRVIWYPGQAPEDRES